MESTQQVEKQSAQETAPSSTRENVADLAFPNLTSLWLSQEPEDQASLKRLKQVWDMFSSGWSPQDKMHIYRLLPEVRTNPTNRKVPSKHKLYKHDITFGLWVILRCIYPDQKLPALRLALMERYPDDTVILIPKFEPNLDQIRSSKPDKPSAQRLKEVESKMRGMVLGEPHSASYNNFLKSKSSTAPVDVSNYAPDITKLCISPSAMQKADVASLASDDSSPEDDSAQTVLSNKQFLELKNLITNVTTDSKRDVSSEMRKMHTETTKQIQNMHTEMIDQFKKNRKTLVDIGKQVAELRAHIELARMDRKDLDEVEARAINLEQFILSL
ncbi:hypothetical protein FGLOB1_4644 [Fusarium globosum]|uniref:Uncharacterized protein n=1 Tax=Fusarium globosum TaxID=78864 RepID=A0A8H6DCV7_9HYPO|nr:hypothetical protein FGLOB1_4644 [Fusarium globosum]